MLLAMFCLCLCSEPDYEFEKELNDADAYEKETAEFECEVNDEEAPVQWFREDKVGLRVSPDFSCSPNTYLHIDLLDAHSKIR